MRVFECSALRATLGHPLNCIEKCAFLFQAACILSISFSHQAEAQSLTTYQYTGAALDVDFCEITHTHFDAFLNPHESCQSGNIAGTITFSNLPESFTG